MMKKQVGGQYFGRRFRRHFGRAGWILGAVVAAVALGGCKDQNAATGGTAGSGDATGEPILIGEYGSMTGAQASFGQNTHKGVMMAVDEINKKGGVLGRQIKVQLEDTAGKPDQAVTAVQKLIKQDQALAIVGEVASSNSLAAAPVCQSAKVPMISPASTNPAVTEVGDYIFRTCFIDPFQGTVGATFAKDKLQAKTAAIFIDNKSDYSKGLAKFFREAFTNNGGKIVAEQSYAQGDSDFRGQLTILKGSNPDVVFLPGYYTEVGLIVLQARRMGMNQPFLGGDGWHSDKLFEIGKDAVNSSDFSTHFSPESDDPRVVAFVDEFKTRYQQEPEAMAALGYDAARILFAAIERAGGTDRAKIRDEIAKTTDFAGVTGDITLNEQRNAVKPAVVLEVDKGKFKYLETIKP